MIVNFQLSSKLIENANHLNLKFGFHLLRRSFQGLKYFALAAFAYGPLLSLVLTTDLK